MEIKKASSENPVPPVWERFSEEAFGCYTFAIHLIFPNCGNCRIGQDLAPVTPTMIYCRNRLLRFHRACPSTFLDKSSIFKRTYLPKNG